MISLDGGGKIEGRAAGDKRREEEERERERIQKSTLRGNLVGDPPVVVFPLFVPFFFDFRVCGSNAPGGEEAEQ
eukprot:scaffold300089_cov28-Tisochrysis_lutea.AAC.1